MAEKIRILLVEDESITAIYMQRQLGKMGYEVSDYVTTGELAITRAWQEQPDIILMDIKLAGEIDGIDAAIVIRQRSNVPIVFVTSYDDQVLRERASEVDPLNYITKPVILYKLKMIIDDYFSLKK